MKLLPRTYISDLLKLPRLDLVKAMPHGAMRPFPDGCQEVYVLGRFDLEEAKWSYEPAAIVLNRGYTAIAWVAAIDLPKLEQEIAWAKTDTEWEEDYPISYLHGHLCDCSWYDAEDQDVKQRNINLCDGCLEMLQDGLCPMYPNCGRGTFDIQSLLKMDEGSSPLDTGKES